MSYVKTEDEWMSHTRASKHIDGLEEAVQYGTVDKRPEVACAH